MVRRCRDRRNHRRDLDARCDHRPGRLPRSRVGPTADGTRSGGGRAMTPAAQERARWLVVVVFAAGMAWVESACVYYLRVLVDRVNPYQPVPLPVHAALGPVELVRETATLVMLLTVGMLAGRTR